MCLHVNAALQPRSDDEVITARVDSVNRAGFFIFFAKKSALVWSCEVCSGTLVKSNLLHMNRGGGLLLVLARERVTCHGPVLGFKRRPARVHSAQISRSDVCTVSPKPADSFYKLQEMTDPQ